MKKGKITEDVFINDSSDNDSRLMHVDIHQRHEGLGYIMFGYYNAYDANCNGTVDLSGRCAYYAERFQS